VSSPAVVEHRATQDENPAREARRDLIGGTLWTVLGCSILIASWRMDRLENQDVNPYTVPGLLPGLLGIVLMLFGTLLAVRGLRRGGRPIFAQTDFPSIRDGSTRQIVSVLALCLVFGVGLVGRGLPFWAAGALFVSVSILVLQNAGRRASGIRLDARQVGKAVLIGVVAGVGITVLFQDIFLVHLP
jgi:hypothetical protein